MDIWLCRDSIKVVGSPLAGGYKVVAWYLTHRKSVDDILERNKWNIYSLASIGE
jgi:hypothetical protein